MKVFCFLSDLSSVVCMDWIFFFFFCLFGTMCFPPLKIPLSAVGGVGAVSQWGGDGTLSVACILLTQLIRMCVMPKGGASSWL